jgi:ADP-heptose:LPS heptosyltransferase
LRSITLDELKPLFALSNVSFWSLQKEQRPGDATQLKAAGVIDLSSHLTDFAQAAAVIAELDLLISVDTAVAHLAGALGRPVWTLLAYAADWRYGTGPNETPWYPTMRLFRQQAGTSWRGVIERVTIELAALANSPSAKMENLRGSHGSHSDFCEHRSAPVSNRRFL